MGNRIIKNAKVFKVNSLFEMASPKQSMIDSFWETLIDIVNAENIDRIGTSYSYLSSTEERNLKLNPDEDFKKILAALEAEGWDKEHLSLLFDKYGNEIAKEYDKSNKYVMLTGKIDYFMYKMTNGKTLLMGYNTTEIDGKPGENNFMGEAFYKFNYGYNKTPYGKLAMAQHFGSLDNYYDFIGENMVHYFMTTKETDLQDAPAEFMKAIEENYKISDLSKYYSYDKASKTAKLDLAAAGINIGDEKVIKPEKRGPVNIRKEGGEMERVEDYQFSKNMNMHDMLADALNQLGVPFKEGDREISAGGQSVIENGIVTMYIDPEKAH